MSQETISLFKYYSCEAYNLDALANGYLWFSNPMNLNDPFDCNFEGFRESKVFSVFKPELVQKMYDLFEKIAICSFTQDPLSQHFWSLYAANYSGFCLVFDRVGLTRKLFSLGIFSNEVTYQDQPLSIDYELLKRMNERPNDFDYKHLLEAPLRENAFVKNSEVWGNEKEVRAFLGGICIGNMISGENDIKKGNNGYKVPIRENKLLKEIILGHNISAENKALIENLVKHNYSDIKISQIKLDFENHQLKVMDTQN